MLDQRQESRAYLLERLVGVAQTHGERVLHTPLNDISFAISLGHATSLVSSVVDQNNNDEDVHKRMSFFGAMLFQRGISGARYVTELLPSMRHSSELYRL